PGNHIAGGLKIRTQRLTHSLQNTGRLQDVRPRYEQNRLAWKEGVRKRIGNKAKPERSKNSWNAMPGAMWAEFLRAASLHELRDCHDLQPPTRTEAARPH